MATQTIPLINGNYYHIYNRGNNRENIFKEEENYYYFLKLWKKHIHPIADTYAYCLLKNHFHALVKIKEDVPERPEDSKARMNVAEQHFANLFNAYAKAFNKRFERTGKLFEERFKRKVIDSDAYFTQIIYYIHTNPQNHGFVDDFRDYIHSSYYSFLSNGKTALQRKEVLEWFGSKDLFEDYHNNLHFSLKDLKKFEIEDD